jgi:hypothetical protein
MPVWRLDIAAHERRSRAIGRTLSMGFGNIKYFKLSADFIVSIQRSLQQTAVYTFGEQAVYCHTQSSTFLKIHFGSNFRLDTSHHGKSADVYCPSKSSNSYSFSSMAIFYVCIPFCVQLSGCIIILVQH